MWIFSTEAKQPFNLLSEKTVMPSVTCLSIKGQMLTWLMLNRTVYLILLHGEVEFSQPLRVLIVQCLYALCFNSQ